MALMYFKLRQNIISKAWFCYTFWFPKRFSITYLCTFYPYDGFNVFQIKPKYQLESLILYHYLLHFAV